MKLDPFVTVFDIDPSYDLEVNMFKRHLKNAGFERVKHMEIGKGYSLIWEKENHNYAGCHVIFFSRFVNETVKELAKEWKNNKIGPDGNPPKHKC